MFSLVLSFFARVLELPRRVGGPAVPVDAKTSLGSSGPGSYVPPVTVGAILLLRSPLPPIQEEIKSTQLMAKPPPVPED